MQIPHQHKYTYCVLRVLGCSSQCVVDVDRLPWQQSNSISAAGRRAATVLRSNLSRISKREERRIDRSRENIRRSSSIRLCFQSMKLRGENEKKRPRERKKKQENIFSPAALASNRHVDFVSKFSSCCLGKCALGLA